MGVSDVGRRGKGPSRKMHQVGALFDDDRRRCRRADVGRRSWGPSREFNLLGAPVEDGRGHRGHADVRRRGRPLPRDALNGCDGSRRPDAVWALPM